MSNRHSYIKKADNEYSICWLKSQYGKVYFDCSYNECPISKYIPLTDLADKQKTTIFCLEKHTCVQFTSYCVVGFDQFVPFSNTNLWGGTWNGSVKFEIDTYGMRKSIQNLMLKNIYTLWSFWSFLVGVANVWQNRSVMDMKNIKVENELFRIYQIRFSDRW